MRPRGPRPLRYRLLRRFPRILGLVKDEPSRRRGARDPSPKPLDLRIKVAGFGGQGVLMLGEVLAEAGPGSRVPGFLAAFLRPRDALGNLQLPRAASSDPVDSPVVSRPNMLLALNEPSLRKFLPAMEPGGTVLYNAEELPEDCACDGVRMVVRPFTRLADEMGAAKAANIVMLGALLEATGLLEERQIVAALRRKGQEPEVVRDRPGSAGARAERVARAGRDRTGVTFGAPATHYYRIVGF